MQPIAAESIFEIGSSLPFNLLLEKEAGRGKELHGFERTKEAALQYIDSLQDSNYGLLFGSSVVRRNIIPVTLDEASTRSSAPTSSFNLGMLGAGGHEVNYYIRDVIEEIADSELPLPEWVLVDISLPMDYQVILNDSQSRDNARSRRAEAWHDWRETFSVMRTIARDDSATGAEKRNSTMVHWTLTGRRAIRQLRERLWLADIQGLGLELFERRFSDEMLSIDLKGDDLERRGYLPYEGEAAERWREGFAGMHPQIYQNMLRKKRIALARRRFKLLQYNHEAVREQVEYLQDRGILPIYLVGPVTRDTSYVYALQDAGYLPFLLAYDDPSSFGEFFDIESRFDSDHLTNEAAVRFSEHLGQDIASILKSHRRVSDERHR